MPEPYRLRAVGHSLGGASLLIYAVMCRQLGRPHHIYRLILLTPAGFLQKLPLVRRLLLLGGGAQMGDISSAACQTQALARLLFSRSPEYE